MGEHREVWTCKGAVTGECGVKHRSVETAERCCVAHDRAIKRHSGWRPGALTTPYSDRTPVMVRASADADVEDLAMDPGQSAQSQEVTVALEVASSFGFDGQRFRDDSGRHIADFCSAVTGVTEYHHGGFSKFVFRDRSSIVVSDEGWDEGCSDNPACHCWQSVGCRCQTAEPDVGTLAI